MLVQIKVFFFQLNPELRAQMTFYICNKMSFVLKQDVEIGKCVTA